MLLDPSNIFMVLCFSEMLSNSNEDCESEDSLIVKKVFILLTVINNLTGDDLEPNSIAPKLRLLNVRSHINHFLEDKQIFAAFHLLNYFSQALIIVKHSSCEITLKNESKIFVILKFYLFGEELNKG